MDKEFYISDIGPSIVKMIGDIQGQNFKDLFYVKSPKNILLEDEWDLQDMIGKLLVVESILHPIKTTFRGQLIFLKESNQIIYINTPWFSDLNQMDIYDLTISDFALNDTTPDLLNVLKSKEIVNADMMVVADELINERNKLIEKNKQVEILAKFQEQNPQPIIRVSFDGELLYFNNSASEIIHLSPFNDSAALFFLYSENIKGKTHAFEIELTINTKTFNVTCVPFVQEQYFNLYLKDISEKVQYQHELEIVNNQFATLINSLHSGLLVENLHRKIVMVNDQFCKYFNIPVSPDQMIGIDCEMAGEQTKKLFDDEDGFIEGVRQIIDNKKAVFGQQLKLKDGRIFERDYFPLISGGVNQGHIWKYDDITELIFSKESLRRVEDKYKKIIEELQFGLIEVDLSQRITKVFPAFCKMTGYEEFELIGQFADVVLGLPEESGKIERHNEDRKQGESGVYETKIKTKEGEIKWVIISGSPILDANNVIIGSIGIHIDITDRKRLEKELIDAQEKAFMYVKAKDMFVAKMSHEIRTPMNVIIGLAELLSEMKLDNSQMNILNSIRLSASNLLGIINDILDFSMLENGHYKLVKFELNTRLLIFDISEIFKLEVQKKGLEWLVEFDEKISENLLGDKQKLNQVLVNLIGNAIKFTSSGWIKLNVLLLNDLDSSQVLRFSVEDSGVGISKESQDEIFSDFTQEDETVSVNFGGSGLGLSISQKIVSKMGGEIKLKSIKGEGSHFSFDLVLDKNFSPIIREEESQNVDLDTALNILVAEDNVQNQLLISTLLKKANVSFELVENGQMVIDIVKNVHFDLILMDIQMPVLNGFETLKLLRQSGNMIPVIALTANASEDDRRKYLAEGFNSVVVKPYRRNDLYSEIKNVLLKFPLTIDNLIVNNTITENESEELLFSLEEVNEIVGKDKVLLKELIALFLENTSALIVTIVNGTREYDYDKVKFAMHQIKPSLMVFKAYKVLTELSILEELVTSKGNYDEMEIQLGLVETKAALMLEQVKNVKL